MLSLQSFSRQDTSVFSVTTIGLAASKRTPDSGFFSADVDRGQQVDDRASCYMLTQLTSVLSDFC